MEQIIKILIEEYARQIGLVLLDGDIDFICNHCLTVLKVTVFDDIQTILLDALYSLQEERVGKSSLVLI